MMRATRMELARGVVIAGKYRLERPLATGGMGSVWVARHAQLDTPAAIKFMDPQSASSAVARARFEREAKASAALHNRHVVRVLDYGVEGETLYLVMELLQGEDLSRRLHRERRLSLEAASRILTQTAKGLRTAHEARVVHRDLKPANIFLARVPDDDEEIVKLLDFGIAKDTATTAIGEGTKTGELMGSPHYMSPEQVRGARDLDLRSDLWSLSVVMFRAITGRLPFTGDQIGAVIAQILADPIPVATNVAHDLPPALDGFFARGFSRDRDRRFQSAREMAEALAAIAAAKDAQPAQDEPPTRPMMASFSSLEAEAAAAADLYQAPSARPEMLSIPTEPFTPPSLQLTTGPLAGTGGPVIHTAPPPPARPSARRWLPLAGAGVGVLVGAVAFLAGPSGARPAPAAAASATSPWILPPRPRLRRRRALLPRRARSQPRPPSPLPRRPPSPRRRPPRARPQRPPRAPPPRRSPRSTTHRKRLRRPPPRRRSRTGASDRRSR